jgi:hypothetical protein
MQAVRYGDAVLLASDDPNQREILQIQVMTAEA